VRTHGRPPPGGIDAVPPAWGQARPSVSKHPAGPQVGNAIGGPPGSPGRGIAMRGGAAAAGAAAGGGTGPVVGGTGTGAPRARRAARSRSPGSRIVAGSSGGRVGSAGAAVAGTAARGGSSGQSSPGGRGAWANADAHHAALTNAAARPTRPIRPRRRPPAARLTRAARAAR
jgi:hypothetical protein